MGQPKRKRPGSASQENVRDDASWARVTFSGGVGDGRTQGDSEYPDRGEPCSVAADGDRVFVIGTEP